MIVQIGKSIANGEVIAPPSKSYAHRLIIGAALAKGISKIKNIELSSDIMATLNSIESLGASYRFEDNQVTIKGIDYTNQPKMIFIDACESGSTLRFFIPIALLMKKKVHFRGTKKLMSRGFSVYEKIFEQQQIKYTKDDENLYLDGSIKADQFMVDGKISSQFITGLLYALPLLEEDSQITIESDLESKDYMNITIDVLKKCGIEIQTTNNIIDIKGRQNYHTIDEIVEADYSNAVFLDVFNMLGGSVIVKGLNEDSLQGDKKYKEYFKVLDIGFNTINIANCVDLGPILMAVASLKNGAIFTGTKRLAIKESNRAVAMQKELKKFGADIVVMENTVIVKKTILHQPNETIDGHNDHRIVMAMTVMLTIFGGRIRGCEAVNKSYPTFFRHLEKLGVDIQYEINEE